MSEPADPFLDDVERYQMVRQLRDALRKVEQVRDHLSGNDVADSLSEASISLRYAIERLDAARSVPSPTPNPAVEGSPDP